LVKIDSSAIIVFIGGICFMRELFNEQEISRTLTRISHEIIEKNKGVDNLVLIGILTRGRYLANRIQEIIKSIDGVALPCGYIDITNYRDDQKKSKEIDNTLIPFSIENKKIILVDDVFFSGRTIRAAMDGLMKRGRPLEIQLVELIDRGHRQLPIRANYVGKNVPTSVDEIIEVRLKEIDGMDSVILKDGGE